MLMHTFVPTAQPITAPNTAQRNSGYKHKSDPSRVPTARSIRRRIPLKYCALAPPVQLSGAGNLIFCPKPSRFKKNLKGYKPFAAPPRETNLYKYPRLSNKPNFLLISEISIPTCCSVSGSCGNSSLI